MATCRNQTKCGRCWGNGHIGARCKKLQNHLTKPVRSLPQPKTYPPNASEPSFDELLEGGLPLIPRPLPQERPAKTYCYINRDEHHHQEIVRLENAVVLYAPDIEVDLTIDQVAEYAAMSGLVDLKDVSIGILNGSRYLIHLPHDIQPSRFISAIPDKVWELGFSFSQWSQAKTTICIPKYKALLDLVGVPVHLSNENDISKAVSSFGVYLGTLEQCTVGDLAYWTVAVAVTEIENIPYEIDFVYGGQAKPVEIRSKGWLPSPLYKLEELPRTSPAVSRQPEPEEALSETEEGSPRGETISLSRKILVDLCRGRDLASLPPEVREVLLGEEEEVPHEGNMATTTRDAIDDPSQNVLHAAQVTDTGAVEKQIEVLLGPKDVNDVADQIHKEVTPSTHIIKELAPQQISKVSEIQPNTSQGTRTRVLGDKKGGEPSQRASRARKQKQIRTVPSLTRGRSTGATIPHRRNNVMPPGGHVLRLSNTLKRKPRVMQRESSTVPRPKMDRSSTRPKDKGKEKADLSLNPEGFFEVRVDFQHCANLAEACGIRVDQISDLLKEDNQDRSTMPIQQQLLQLTEEISETDQGDRISDFDPLSDDELSSGSV